jgi:hypothetical protein
VAADTPPIQRGLYGQRPSKSADAARRHEFERLAAMSPKQRVLLALYLGRRSRSYQKRFGRKQDAEQSGE